MAFDNDILSAIEEAFGADTAALMEGLELDSTDASSGEEAFGNSNLDDLVAQLDQEILASTRPELPDQPLRRFRSIEDKYVLVQLGDSRYGLPMNNVLEIQQLPDVTYLPNLPEWVPGVCNLHGNILSIVDLKQLLGFEVTNLSSRTRLVVARTNSHDLTTGFVVDEVVRILELEPAQIRPPVGPLEGQLGPFVKGTYEASNAVICMLDLENLLNSPTLRLH